MRPVASRRVKGTQEAGEPSGLAGGRKGSRNPPAQGDLDQAERRVQLDTCQDARHEASRARRQGITAARLQVGGFEGAVRAEWTVATTEPRPSVIRTSP